MLQMKQQQEAQAQESEKLLMDCYGAPVSLGLLS